MHNIIKNCFRFDFTMVQWHLYTLTFMSNTASIFTNKYVIIGHVKSIVFHPMILKTIDCIPMKKYIWFFFCKVRTNKI